MLKRLGTSFCCACTNSVDDRDLGPTTDARVSDEPAGITSKNPSVQTAPGKLNWTDIKSATSDFAASAIIGEGGFSTVYKAQLCGAAVAVKLHRPSERLHRAFRQELHILLRLRHPNIVRLLGFCDDREEGILVFEQLTDGSLHEKLHGSFSGAGLSWTERMRIAYDVAGALDYLHDGCDLQIIHGDIKSSNVLLDNNNKTAKLIDFGFARMGFSAAVSGRQMVGSPGYVDPHYLRSGLVSKKSDLYSFGVLLLELVTGKEAIVAEREQRLTAVVRTEMAALAGGDRTKVAGMVDGRIGGSFDVGEAAAMVAVAAACVGENPSRRPAMAEVRRMMRESVPSVVSTVGLKSDGVGFIVNK